MPLPHPCRPEAEVVQGLLDALGPEPDWPQVMARARPWVKAIKDHPAPPWALETLLQEFPISSREGLALMRLAEALLRVPDLDTAIALTADQLQGADFSGHHDSTLARLSGVALGLSRHLLPAEGQPGGLLERLGARAVVAATIRAVQLLGRQFVLGETIEDALQRAERTRQAQPGVLFSFDMLGEGARTEADAQRYLDSYRQALSRLAEAAQDRSHPCQAHGLSIKLSALHPRYEHAQQARIMAELVPRVWRLCDQAAQANLNLTLDAEEVDRLALSLQVFDALCARVAAEHPQWQGFGLAMQAYQTRAPALVGQVVTTARRHGIRLMCRLVKGAYWDAEVKRAQQAGLPHYPVFTHKHHTDISYLACARALLDAPDAVFPQFATHNAGTVAAVIAMARARGADFELQRLHGMGEGLYREVLKDAQLRCRVYAPVGQHRDLLAYLVRRLLENGANASFVHQMADPRVDVDQLLVSPLHPAPTSGLPLPGTLYGPTRRNSTGPDLSVDTELEALLQVHGRTTVPSVPLTPVDAVAPAVARSLTAFQAWRLTDPAQRIAHLHRTADALQAALPRFCALLVKEARKTWPDAIAEVREAIDFLRYYADEAARLLAPVALPAAGPGFTGERNELRLFGRGPWVCISPWNFPLAIFTGQVAAALVTGNTVLAKPAEQTPGVAQALVQLLHEAGVTADVLQCLNGPGDTVGAALVAHEGVAGVAFTGSTATARRIHRALAAREGPIVPLIAETGGINAMVVDATALPEQVVDAVVRSAFHSAGQRCSALRLLCLHEGVADRVLPMLEGAVQLLQVGDPADPATDVGPVIDAQAFAQLQGHIRRLEGSARALWQPATPDDPARGLIAPRAFEVGAVREVTQEIFGPVLQVLRWSGDPQALIDAINGLGWGLTLGIQTRIDGRALKLARQARVGNVYVNRAMTGAVVGLQPFGGEGLSGTGPKAGGPHYLARFCTEQTLSIDTTAAGGNVDLMAASAPAHQGTVLPS